MNKLITLILLLLSSPFAHADIADDLNLRCVAVLDLPGEKISQRVNLKRASYDKVYFEAKLEHFSFGADTYFLEDGGIGLMIFNKENKGYSNNIVGFRHIPNTKYFIAESRHKEPIGNGEFLLAHLKCIHGTLD